MDAPLTRALPVQLARVMTSDVRGTPRAPWPRQGVLPSGATPVVTVARRYGRGAVGTACETAGRMLYYAASTGGRILHSHTCGVLCAHTTAVWASLSALTMPRRQRAWSWLTGEPRYGWLGPRARQFAVGYQRGQHIDNRAQAHQRRDVADVVRRRHLDDLHRTQAFFGHRL